jgi:hypothetical protein
MGILGKIFGTEKAIDKGLSIIDKTVGHVASGLDSAWFTEQEKAEGNIKSLGMRMEMVKSLQDEFTPRAVTRRILALIIFANFFLHANLWVYFAWKQNADMVVTMKELLGMELQLTLLVAFFYFGYYGLKKVLGK